MFQFVRRDFFLAPLKQFICKFALKRTINDFILAMTLWAKKKDSFWLRLAHDFNRRVFLKQRKGEKDSLHAIGHFNCSPLYAKD